MFRQSVIALALLSLSGCSSTAKISLDNTQINKIMEAQEQSLFKADSPLLTKDIFIQVSLALASVNDEQQADKLLYYLRAFSYFGPKELLDSSSIEALTLGLSELTNKPFFSRSPRLQEHFAVTIYRYYSDNDNAQQLAKLLPMLEAQLISLGESNTNLANDYGLWETLRAYGMLFNSARKDVDGELNQQIVALDLAKPLLDFASSNTSIREGNDWPKANAYWALGLYRLALPTSDENKPTLAEDRIDKAVAEIAKVDISIRGDDAKDTYTLGFHVNAFAGKDRCEQNSDICRIPELTDILPIHHPCSDSLFILAQDLNQEELASSCTKLTSQEANFHQILETGHQATPNDFNTALRVVAFKNWSQYNAYGQLLFDINTDNGGMYIEGTPSKPGNQATFFAYRQFWIQPEFAIWNLNHEYVHYLDGHFVKYGGFGHFPSKMVWWSEGLAEYIAKGDSNPNTLKVIKRDIEKAPTLEEIFATEYDDGQDRTYKWSYMAVRFLAEHHHSDFVQLSQFLKTDYFEGYEQLLQSLTQYQPEFSNWLNTQVNQFDDNQDKNKVKVKINKLNRYSYREYLKPTHLVQDKKHLHY
ncbi:collagenase [Shewanella woodyi]|uniref:Microbial collagenase n=1 Tax=Shewanella woodyi (strain ATCC 51908 / MS32) TaxID=392500 RepID=B1KCW8_SHEWM|nr:collagenase [Shewanella woodyi]ACA84343.1 Microbial collagenase [Shewanella woodyi ATCC 51908]